MKCAFIDLGKHFGGAENYLLVLIGRWVAAGNEAVVVTRKKSKFEQAIVDSKIKAEVYGVEFTYSNIKRTRKILLRKKVDIIDINGINSGLFTILMKLPIRRVTTVHSNADIDRAEKTRLIRKAFVELENYCLHQSDKVIVVSKAIEKLLLGRKIESNKICLIQNGVKEIMYAEKKLRKNAREPLRICYVGRLEKVKGCEHLISALKGLKDVDYICDIYGDGSLVDTLKKLVAEDDDKVHFRGFSSGVRKVLPQYDVLVLPSLYEAFPLIIPEAMNAKVLLVCSNVGGIPYIIEDQINGYLFERGNAEQLGIILTKIAKNPEPQIKIINQAYADFKRHYTEDAMIKKTFAVLEEK